MTEHHEAEIILAKALRRARIALEEILENTTDPQAKLLADLGLKASNPANIAVDMEEE